MAKEKPFTAIVAFLIMDGGLHYWLQFFTLLDSTLRPLSHPRRNVLHYPFDFVGAVWLPLARDIWAEVTEVTACQFWAQVLRGDDCFHLPICASATTRKRTGPRGPKTRRDTWSRAIPDDLQVCNEKQTCPDTPASNRAIQLDAGVPAGTGATVKHCYFKPLSFGVDCYPAVA